MYATHASVVMVKPAGTRSAPRTRVISATLAPLPPSSSRMSREPSAKSYTHFVSAIPGRILRRVRGRWPVRVQDDVAVLPPAPGAAAALVVVVGDLAGDGREPL